MLLLSRLLVASAACALFFSPAGAAPVINEIMFHPPGVPENPALEWIEIFNDSPATADLSGWQLTKGVSFTFPAMTLVAPGGYLVVAANVAAFQAAHPSFAGPLVGGWTGRLSSSGENIRLTNGASQKINEVAYADEGDWATRARGPLSFGHRGWIWTSAADGGGRTLELRNPALGNDNGQNWGASAVAGGTPGAANSLASSNVAPLITDVKHRPQIPRSTDPIVISADFADEGENIVATLRWRVDAGAWMTEPMVDTDGDGDREATILAKPHLTVIEYYVQATDGTSTRSWPALARTSDPGVTPEAFGFVTNALLQVDNGFVATTNFTVAGNQPIYRFIMTNAERAELAQIGSSDAEAQSEATMNGTFISQDGTGVEVRYQSGFRNRGLSSALGPPNNFHVAFPGDAPWNDRSSLQINCQYGYSQVLGNSLFQLAGIPPQEAAIVRVRVNGTDLAETGARMYGRYARLEGRGGAWAERHYPNDADGNFYRLDDHAYGQGDPLSGEFRYEGESPALYSDTFFKETNQEENDFSDVIEFARVVSAPLTGGNVFQPAIANSAYIAAVSAKLDLEQFYRFIATDALIGNQEGGPQSGRADDVSIYRGVADPRFRFIPHDMDDVFDIGNGAGNPITRSIFSYDGGTTPGTGFLGLTRLFNHPQLVPRYYAAVLEGLNTWFNHATIDPVIDQIMAGWVPASGGASPPNSSIATIKAFIDARRANVLAQIPQTYSFNVTTAGGTTTEGYRQTTDGAATFSGAFNVARTYSITVNGVLATMNYRTTTTLTAGTWSLATTAGGGGVLRQGLNKVVVNFWDAPAGGGNILQALTANVYYNAPGAGTTVSGTLSAGSLRLIAPASYLPGKPFQVRVDLLNAQGGLDRAAWNTTVTLTSSVGAITLPSVTLYNGMGSALVTVGAAATNPGGFTLTANSAGFTAQKAVTSLGLSPVTNSVTGTLAAGTTTWSGVMRVIGDVTVPTGAILNIAAGTHVLFDGDATPGSTAGKRLIVNGTLNSQGTLASPVNMTAFNAGDRWGQISFSNAQPSTLTYTLINHGGHASGVGHTGRGPLLRLATSTVSLLDSVLGDGPGKAIYSSGTCSLTIQRSLINRVITGPELEDGCALLCEDSNIQLVLPDYRESNAAAPDDEDCMYVHNGSGRSVVMRRSVFARCGDDLFDCLGGPIIVEDSILREGWDKGMSLLNNDLTISRTLIVQCDKAIVPKSSTAATRTVNATNLTIVSENHDTSQSPWGYVVPPSNPDPDSPSTGFYTQNKSGQSNAGATLTINAKNCIVLAQSPVLIDAPYNAANTVVTYSDLLLNTGAPFVWPGEGNISADPLFAAATTDYRLQETSPGRDAGDPATFDPDGSRADLGALPFTNATAVGTLTWSPQGSPYRVTGNVTIPTGTTLVMQAGTAVQFVQNTTLTVNGTLKVQGTAAAHIVMSHVPGATGLDPITNMAGQPAKWGGVRVVGPGSPFPMSTGHEVRYVDFINAQPPTSAGNEGSLGIIRAEAWVDHCTWIGSRLRLLYGKNCSLTVTHCDFPNEFDPANNADNPVAYNLDNIAEPMKVEFPVGAAGSNPELLSNSNYTIGLPVGGHWRCYYNDFHGNKGHNDVFDADSGRFGQTQVLDCRYNWFHGLTGDEHIDLGGDAYIASNIFEAGHKDIWTNDRGYSNAISSGDKGSGTTIWVARNVAFNMDHVINCKVSTATIFEHNTVANMSADFSYTSTPPVTPFTQDVRCSAINLFVPDDSAPLPGDGAYAGFNLFHSIPRVITWADLPSGTTSKLEASNNYLNAVTDNSVGPVTAQYSGGTQHPGGFTSLGTGNIAPGDPQFIDPAAKNYALKFNSPARATALGGLDYGATVAEWAFIQNGPTPVTASNAASFTVGGPGIVAYKWRLDGGAWSARIQIGEGAIFSRTNATVRRATLNLASLAPGAHTLEVLGQDAAGNWQDADPARTIEGLPQAAPTARTWTVDPNLPALRLSEILADSAIGQPDTIEIFNASSGLVLLSDYSLSDDPSFPGKYPFPANTFIGGLAYGAVSFNVSGIDLERDGDAVYLYRNGVLVDSIAFGHQLPDLTLGRAPAGAWTLGTPTLGSANVAVRLGDPAAARINEWFTGGDVLYASDWVELANPSALPIDLGGLRITDNRIGDPAAHVFAPFTFVAANGFIRFDADGDPELGPSHLGISFDAQQENIALLDASGRPLDAVFFYPQTSDWSMGRNATGGLVFYELPTRGLANGTADPGYANALALLRGLRVTELMFNAIGGSDYDFVELRNVGATSVQLGGVKFVEGIDFTFPAMTLGVGQNVIVAKNVTKFRNRYGNTPSVVGAYSGQLDNGGEDLALRLPPPFDANLLTFKYRDDWVLATDGRGPSLIVSNPLVPAREWSDRDTWIASPINGGDPDGVSASTQTYAGWSALFAALSVNADDDSDGVAALVEFGLGMSSENPNAGNGQAGSPIGSTAPDGRLQLIFLVPANASAAQGHGFSDIVYRVQAADSPGAWTTIATKTFSAGWTGEVAVGAGSSGLVSVTVTDPITAGSAQRFLRLQVSWLP